MFIALSVCSTSETFYIKPTNVQKRHKGKLLNTMTQIWYSF